MSIGSLSFHENFVDELHRRNWDVWRQGIETANNRFVVMRNCIGKS